MAGRSSAERGALDAQNRRSWRCSTAPASSIIAPDIIQPADMLPRIARARISAPAPLCSPIPWALNSASGPISRCRLPLSSVPCQAIPRPRRAIAIAVPAFRFQPAKPASSILREFDQAGIEWFGAPIPSLPRPMFSGSRSRPWMRRACSRYRIRIGDLGLFRALLRILDMPERWRRRLQHQFWRPRHFREPLDLLTGEERANRDSSISANVDEVAEADCRPLRSPMSSASSQSGRFAARRRPQCRRDRRRRLLEKALDRSEKRARSPATASVRSRIYLAIDRPLPDSAAGFGSSQRGLAAAFARRPRPILPPLECDATGAALAWTAPFSLPYSGAASNITRASSSRSKRTSAARPFRSPAAAATMIS